MTERFEEIEQSGTFSTGQLDSGFHDDESIGPDDFTSAG